MKFRCLPTFIHDLSKLLAETGTTFKLYSPYPFPIRAGRELDAFAAAAWEALGKNPDRPFSRAETIAGRDIVRVAVADTMVSQVCVDCHNSRADSPKVDWKLNDLRGVLEIDIDVTEALERGVWMGRGIALILLALFGAVLALTFFRMRSVVIAPANTMTDVMQSWRRAILTSTFPTRTGSTKSATWRGRHSSARTAQSCTPRPRTNWPG